MRKFEELNIENGFTLDQEDAIKYLEWVAENHARAIMSGVEDAENIEAVFDDLKAMKDDIIRHNHEHIEFVECPASGSGIDIAPLIGETELRYAIEDMAEWVLNNCTNLPEDTPLIFKSKKDQALLERIIKERLER